MLRKIFAVLAFSTLATAAPLAAHADTINNYAFNATLFDGSANGTVSFDETTGLFTGGSITETSSAGSVLFNTFDSSGTFDTVTYAFFLGSGQTFQITIPGLNNVGYTGGAVCADTTRTGCFETGLTDGTYYITGNQNQDFASRGSLAPTPEPSSLVLLGTGVISAAGMLRRRLKK